MPSLMVLKMKKFFWALTPVFAFCLSSCIAGSGFVFHRPSDIKTGEAFQISIQFSVNAGNALGAFSDAVLHYKLENEKSFSQIRMERISGTKECVEFSVPVPGINKEYIGKQFVYYFTFLMDGIESCHPHSLVNGVLYCYPKVENFIIVKVVE
jgi:hypothetical protein